jgi:Sugar (and other) transporter
MKQNGHHAKLNQLMGKIYESDRIKERLDLITVDTGSKSSSPGYKETIMSPKYRYATLLGCLLSCLQQLSGINAVMFYSSKIFVKIGIQDKLGSGLVGFINMISTFGALFLLGSKFKQVIA